MTGIQHIVFDIGRVLLHWDPELPYLDLIPDAERRRWFLETVCSPAWNAEQDRGRDWAEAEALLIEGFPEEQDLIRAYRARWHDMVPHAYDDVVEVLNRLIDDGHDVTMLTNFNDQTFTEVRARFPFLDRPRGVTVSGEVRLVKPEPEIYSWHASSFALKPSAILFTDDSPANVAAAQAAGWNAVLFRDAEQLKADLREHGIAI